MRLRINQTAFVFGIIFTLVFVSPSSGRITETGFGKAEITDGTSYVSPDCKSTCQDIYRKRIKVCNTVYPSDSRSDEHTACLKKAKTEFDDCLASCK